MNKLTYITLSEIETILNGIKKNKKIYIANIDGSTIPKFRDYLNVISQVFQFPYRNDKGYELNVNGYYDWMRDLEWLDKEGYVLIIYNYSLFLDEDKEAKKSIIDGFLNYILPFWEEEVKHVVVEGVSKPFNVYLVD